MSENSESPSRRVDPTIIVAVMEELAELLSRLADGRRQLHQRYRADTAAPHDKPDMTRTRALDRRQDMARKALDDVLTFLHSGAVLAFEPDILRRSLTAHLRDLHDAMGDLDAGVTPDLFELPPGRRRKASPSEARFRGMVAAAMEMLCRAGDEPQQAGEVVADVLKRANYRTPWGKKSERGGAEIRTSTVMNWHKRKEEWPLDGPGQRAFNQMMRDAQDWHEHGESWRDLSIRVLAMLHADNPDGPATYLPLRGDPDPRK